MSDLIKIVGNKLDTIGEEEPIGITTGDRMGLSMGAATGDFVGDGAGFDVGVEVGMDVGLNFESPRSDFLPMVLFFDAFGDLSSYLSFTLGFDASLFSFSVLLAFFFSLFSPTSSSWLFLDCFVSLL
mmetsp:Transcript_93089/g.258774  ORF Transcript_93089/g.258774 Transcript_93089/m.258774 type:complete len:127 (+) Transcript_93089:267-647(+)